MTYHENRDTCAERMRAIASASWIERLTLALLHERKPDALFMVMTIYGVETFHAKKFRQRKGSFKGWSEDKRARFNGAFLELADRHMRHGLCTVVRTADFKEVYRAPGQPKRARLDTQYGLCFRGCMWQAMSFMS